MRKDFAVYGSMIEASECLTRLIGQMNTLYWIGEYPDRLGEQILRIGEFYRRMPARRNWRPAATCSTAWSSGATWPTRANMLFSPDYWRDLLPARTSKRMIALCHDHGLPVIYHGCGNCAAILADFIEMGLDAYNPLEAKAGLDVVGPAPRVRPQASLSAATSTSRSGKRATKDNVRREVLRKLNAAKGGGLIFQSDHSVSSGVSGQTYDYIVKLVREFGRYPLNLGEYDETNLRRNDMQRYAWIIGLTAREARRIQAAPCGRMARRART